MQKERAKELRQKWGDKPCDHPKLEKEYHLGGDTGDKICVQCGSEFTSEEAKRLRDRK